MNDGTVRKVHLHLMRFISVVELPADALNFIDTIDISVVNFTFIASHNMHLDESQSRRRLSIFNSQSRYLLSDQKFLRQHQLISCPFVKTLASNETTKRSSSTD